MSPSPQETISLIREVVSEAENAGDVSKMVPFFGKDIVLMAPGFPPVEGPEAVRNFMAGFFDQFDVEAKYLWLYHREEDGSWKHARVTWNANG